MATLVATEERALHVFAIRAHTPARVVLDGDDVAIQWTFDLTDAGGVTRRMEEVALQRWRGDRIERERFFYDPTLPVIEERSPQ